MPLNFNFPAIAAAAATAAAATITTDSSIKLIDALCEGEIEGLVDGAKSIYLNKTAIRNSDGSYNFQPQGSNSYTSIGSANSVPGLFNWGMVPGSNNQSFIPGFGAVEVEISVGQEVKIATGSVTRTVVTPGLDAIAVTVAVPRLVLYDSEGKPQNTNLTYQIYLKVNAGLFILKDTVNITEKNTGGFEIQRILNIPTGGYTSLQVRLVRLTADSTSDKLNNAFYWKSLTETIYKRYNYPGTALIALELNSKILTGGLSERRYQIKGLKIRIPTNATVQPDGSLTYSGAWDGSFTTPIWCADPAWCLYDLLQNPRYGAAIPAAALASTKWDYYTASQWCNGLVTNGMGGLEPRFLLNVVIDRSAKAYDLIAQLAGVFGGIFFVLGGGLSLATDRPLTLVALLTNESAKFNYQNTALRNRYTVAIVSWQNPDLIGDTDIEVVEDATGVALYGFKEIKLTAIGCTRRSQARLFGLWYLFTSRLQSDTCVATTSIAVARLQPGEVIKLADRNKRSYLLGRLVSATNINFVLDRPVALSNTQTWRIHFILPSGQEQTRLLQPTGGMATSNITLATAATAAPVSDAIWVIQATTDTELPQYQILATLPKKKSEWELTLVRYEPDKWQQMNDALTLDTIATVITPTTPNPPRNLSAWTDSLINISTGQITEQLIITWDYPVQFPAITPDPYTQSYEVSYRLTTSNTLIKIPSNDRTVEIDNLTAGFYEVSVRSIDNLGRRSAEISLSDPIPVGIVINASTLLSNNNSAVFLVI
jgi:predicted phage tail protein